MNLRDLQYFVALAEIRHFGRAAKAVHVSQPTLSSQIRKLEEFLGVTLFERGTRKIGLTPVGQAVLGEAREVLAHATQIEEVASAYRDPLAGSFQLGVIASLGPFIAPDLLTQLQHDAPRLDVVLHEALTDELVASVQARKLDAALIATSPEDDDLEVTPLFDEPFLIAHAQDCSLAKAKNVKIGDIENGSLLLLGDGHCLRDQALSLCGAQSVDTRVKSTSLHTLMRMAELDLGVTLVPALAAEFADRLMLRPLFGEGTSRQIGLISRRRYPRVGALQVVANAARVIAAGHNLSVLNS